VRQAILPPHDPVFIVEGVVHYCVANMPGAVAEPAARPLQCDPPYCQELANLGLDAFLAKSKGRPPRHVRDANPVPCRGRGIP